jgi:hypothetical protein
MGRDFILTLEQRQINRNQFCGGRSLRHWTVSLYSLR